jgi:hypothetical protein
MVTLRDANDAARRAVFTTRAQADSWRPVFEPSGKVLARRNAVTKIPRARASMPGVLTGSIIRYSLSAMQALCIERRRWSGLTRLHTLAGVVGVSLIGVLSWAVAHAQAPQLEAHVPTSYANVHETPSSGSAPLVLVPRGTVLPIIGRRGEWIQVRLSPALRETGMVMRWYEGRHELIRRGERITIGDEDSGWMHDSTVQILEAGSP